VTIRAARTAGSNRPPCGIAFGCLIERVTFRFDRGLAFHDALLSAWAMAARPSLPASCMALQLPDWLAAS